jgi:hypothetical protein
MIATPTLRGENVVLPRSPLAGRGIEMSRLLCAWAFGPLGPHLLRPAVTA